MKPTDKTIMRWLLHEALTEGQAFAKLSAKQRIAIITIIIRESGVVSDTVFVNLLYRQGLQQAT